jgi:hypothetical protein
VYPPESRCYTRAYANTEEEPSFRLNVGASTKWPSFSTRGRARLGFQAERFIARVSSTDAALKAVNDRAIQLFQVQ